MATVTKTIGTIARDYSTITAWEADAYGATASDDAIGEMYDDSDFSERVTYNDTTPLSVTLTVPTAERHDGTLTVGVKNIDAYHTGTMSNCQVVGMVLEWQNNQFSGSGNYAPPMNINASSDDIRIRNCIAWCDGANRSSTLPVGFNGQPNGSNHVYITNCFAINLDNPGTSSGRGFQQHYGQSSLYNCTSLAAYNGFDMASPNGSYVSNCMALASVGYDFDTHASVTRSYNLSSDATADGTGSLTNKTTANQVVSTTHGSEDLHIKTGSDAIGAATDLGVTPTNIEIDINGEDRTPVTSWDIGAHQLELTPVVTMQRAKGAVQLSGPHDIARRPKGAVMVYQHDPVAGATPTVITTVAGTFAYTASNVDLFADYLTTITGAAFGYTGSTVDILSGNTVEITSTGFAYTASLLTLVETITANATSFGYTGSTLNVNAEFTPEVLQDTFGITPATLDVQADTDIVTVNAAFSFSGSVVDPVVDLIVTVGSDTFQYARSSFEFTGQVAEIVRAQLLRMRRRGVKSTRHR